MEPSSNKLLRINQAAKMLGVSALTLRNWDAQGKLQAGRHPINNYRVYHIEDIEKLLTEIQTNKVSRSTSRQSRPPRQRGPKKLIVKHEE